MVISIISWAEQQELLAQVSSRPNICCPIETSLVVVCTLTPRENLLALSLSGVDIPRRVGR